MVVKPRVNPEQILGDHLGLTEKSADSLCLDDYFGDGSYRNSDSADILDATLPADGTHSCTEGELFVYRECGKIACKRQAGIVINANGKILDAAAFVAPCTGKQQ